RSAPSGLIQSRQAQSPYHGKPPHPERSEDVAQAPAGRARSSADRREGVRRRTGRLAVPRSNGTVRLHTAPAHGVHSFRAVFVDNFHAPPVSKDSTPKQPKTRASCGFSCHCPLTDLHSKRTILELLRT